MTRDHDPAAPDHVTDDPGRNHRLAVVRDEPRDLVGEATRALDTILREAIGAPRCCFSMAGLTVIEASNGRGVHVTLPAFLASPQVVANLVAFADCLAPLPDAASDEQARLTIDRANLETRIAEAAADRARALAAKAAASYVTDNDRWWAADRAENEATDRLDRAAAEWVEREGRRG
jgi:hypothetical protein